MTITIPIALLLPLLLGSRGVSQTGVVITDPSGMRSLLSVANHKYLLAVHCVQGAESCGEQGIPSLSLQTSRGPGLPREAPRRPLSQEGVGCGQSSRREELEMGWTESEGKWGEGDRCDQHVQKPGGEQGTSAFEDHVFSWNKKIE